MSANRLGRGLGALFQEHEIESIESRMREVIAADLPFSKTMLSLEECCTLFEKNGRYSLVYAV